MTWRDVVQLLAGCLGTGLFYVGFIALNGRPLRWVMLVGCAASAAMICGPVFRHED